MCIVGVGTSIDRKEKSNRDDKKVYLEYGDHIKRHNDTNRI